MKSLQEIKQISYDARIKIIKMLEKSASGHPGGSLSAIDIILVMFFNHIERTKENALDESRHRFVLSKGHGVPALYTALNELGLIEEDEIMTLREVGSRIQGHPDVVLLPYVEASTGSLGQGLSVAQGMALSGKMNDPEFNVYCMVGDGEIQEGQIWEAILSAPKFKLNNLCAILDYNKAQIDGLVKDVMPLESIKAKFESFNWHVIEIDGHNYEEINNAFEEFKTVKDKPTFIIANTIKGKGVSFMEEDLVGWHGVAPNAEQAAKAIKELMNKKDGEE